MHHIIEEKNNNTKKEKGLHMYNNKNIDTYLQTTIQILFSSLSSN